MNITKAQLQAQAQRMQQTRTAEQTHAAHLKLIEHQEIARTQVTATRVARNIQLDSDKGRKIDIDC